MSGASVRQGALLLLAGCLPVTEAPPSCTTCHGSDGSAAPPGALGGSLDSPTIGAHRHHLDGDYPAVPVVCEDCHVVPSAVGDVGHIDTSWPAEVVWNGRLGAGGVWDRATATCSNVYCHGSGLADPAPDPVWTDADDDPEGCDSCHGFPPPAPHPASEDCATCHGVFAADAHIDGTVQLTLTEDCGACHGTVDSPAPPPDLSGSSDPSEPGVGAHVAHLDGGTSAPVQCDACHVVPTRISDAGHLGDDGAELIFGGLAVARSSEPTYSGGTCADSYCHGEPFSAGSNTAPEWTGGPDEAACGACHGLPPTTGHPNNSNCVQCHGAVAGAGQTIATPALHVDGTVQFN